MYSMVSGYQEKVQLRGIFPPQLHLAVVSTEGKKDCRDATRLDAYVTYSYPLELCVYASMARTLRACPANTVIRCRRRRFLSPHLTPVAAEPCRKRLSFSPWSREHRVR